MDGAWRLSARTKTTGGDDDETIFDSLGRPARTFSHGPTPKGQKTPRRMQVFGYDRLSGKTAKRSVLTAEGTPDDQLRFDVFEFDAIGREIRHTTPWNATTTTTYDGFVIDSADLTTSPPRHTFTDLDRLGRPVTITDAAKGKTSYTYGPFNTLQTATDPGGATTTWTLDALGQPRSIDDPDRGVTALEHDGFGELLTSTDALGRVVTFDVDELGREKTRTDKLGAQVQTTTWTWDTAPNGIDRLHTVTSPDAIQSFSYSKRGQIEGMTLTVGNDSFAARQWYDDVGRTKSIDYPQPLGIEPFGVMYERDEHGFVIGVLEKNTQESFWTLTEVDNAGRTRKERFGNDVETTREYHQDKQTLKGISTTFGATNIQKLAYDYDARLNLKSRTDALQLPNKTERFRYDELDRVTCAYFGAVENAQAPCVTSYDYALNGNLTWKSDVGGTLKYDDLDHPHAITKAPGANYGYDAVGNQITRPGGVSVTYTPFDLPRTITKSGKTASFGYDGNQQRIRKTTPAAETLYFGDIFEQITSAAGVVERRFYVHSPERAIAVVTRGGAKPGTRFFHTDHLGSIETITKEDGTVDERRSYDAFGARRNPQWGGASGAFTSSVTRGFTGHEEDDEFGLVNMKGRIFDPHVGRFATTDPILANIWDGQSHNRYAYVFNNPLAFVDPTGFQAQPQPNPGPEIYVDAEGNIGLRQWLIPPEPQKEDDFIIPNHAANIGAYVAPIDVETTGNPPPTSGAAEGIGSFFDGLLYGNLSDNTSWSATLGGIVGGLIPGVGLIADIRDLGAAVAHVADGKDGAWLELGASIVGFLPGGDIAKGVAKGATTATKAVAKVGAEVVDDVAKIAKGGTAAAADGLSAAEKAAGKVHAPRGPPSANPRTATRAQRDAALERAKGPDGVEKCIYCDQPLKRESGYSNSVEIDHRRPYVKGGQTVDTNLDAACRTCNRSKGSKGLGNEWIPPKDR